MDLLRIEKMWMFFLILMFNEDENVRLFYSIQSGSERYSDIEDVAILYIGYLFN